MFIFKHSEPESVRYSLSILYFTHIAVQNVNKAFVSITDFAASLINTRHHIITYTNILSQLILQCTVLILLTVSLVDDDGTH